MKKSILFLLVAILLLGSLTACGQSITLKPSTRWSSDVNETITYDIRKAVFDENGYEIQSPDLKTLNYSYGQDQYLPISCSGTYTTTLISQEKDRYLYSTKLDLIEVFDKTLFSADLIAQLTNEDMVVTSTEDTISIKTVITTECLFENTLAPVSSSRTAKGVYVGTSSQNVTSYSIVNTYTYGAKNKNECLSVKTQGSDKQENLYEYKGVAYDNEMLFLLARCYCDQDNIKSGVTTAQIQLIAPLVKPEVMLINIAPSANADGKYLSSASVASGVWADCYTMMLYPSSSYVMYALCDNLSGNNISYEGLIQYHLPVKLQQDYLVFEIDSIVKIEGLANTFTQGATADTIDLSNAHIVFYANDNADSKISSIAITADMIDNFDTLTVGVHTLTISYASVEYTFDYTVS